MRIQRSGEEQWQLQANRPRLETKIAATTLHILRSRKNAVPRHNSRLIHDVPRVIVPTTHPEFVRSIVDPTILSKPSTLHLIRHGHLFQSKTPLYLYHLHPRT